MRSERQPARASARLALSALLVASCARYPRIDDYPCPPEGTTYGWDDFGHAFFVDYCNGCHGAGVDERHGAPAAYVFDTHAEVQALAPRIFARAAADNTSMPPGPDDPPEVERYALAEWLACGAPP